MSNTTTQRRTTEEANRLALEHQGVVRQIACRYQRLDAAAVRRVGFDEAVAAGNLALVRASRSWPGDGDFRSYAAVTVRHAVIQALHLEGLIHFPRNVFGARSSQERRDAANRAHHVGHLEYDVAARRPDEDDGSAAERAADRAHRLLAALPERQGRALRLHYLDGLTTKQTGGAMGVCDGYVKALCRKALAALRRAVAV